MRPGSIEPEAGAHQVVWWDPFKLKLGEELSQTLWQDEVLTATLKDDGGASLAAYRAWSEDREQLLRDGATPEFSVFLASQAADAPPRAATVEYLEALIAPRPPAGKRFGALVHAVLRDAPLDAPSTAIRQFAELNARILGATAVEMEAACGAVGSALAHPLLAQARAASHCHREYPVTLRLDDGRVLEAVLDLAFIEAGGWIVVDFKTDAATPERRAQYERQLQWYAYALAELTGMPSRAVLLGV